MSSGFVSGLERLFFSMEDPLSTGSSELDLLLGGIRRGVFYYFYGESKAVELLFRHLMVNALKPTGRVNEPRVVYMLCGNYRVEKSVIGTDALIRLVEASGMMPEDALRRVHVLVASSADQQRLLADELEKILETESGVVLVLVRGIFRLYRDDARVRNRCTVIEEVQRSTARLRQLCASRDIPLVASGRADGKRRRLPQPEGGSFLKHLAGVIVYLRSRKGSSEYSRAFVVKNPVQGPRSVEYSFEVSEELGRSTPPLRASFQEMVSKLRREFRDALLKSGRREAFDQLVEAWSSELGAMTFAESLTLLDLMLLVAVVENRGLCDRLLHETEMLCERVSRVEERLSRVEKGEA